MRQQTQPRGTEGWLYVSTAPTVQSANAVEITDEPRVERYVPAPDAEKRIDRGRRRPRGLVWNRKVATDHHINGATGIARSQGLLFAALQRWGSEASAGRVLHHQRVTDDDLLPPAQLWFEVLASAGICAVLWEPDRGHRRTPVRRLLRHLLPERTTLAPRSPMSFVFRVAGSGPIACAFPRSRVLRSDRQPAVSRRPALGASVSASTSIAHCGSSARTQRKSPERSHPLVG